MQKFKVREAAFVLGCSPYVIYSRYKCQIEGGITEEQLDEIQAHLASKGHKPYKYEAAEVERVKFYLASKPEAQQYIMEVRSRNE